MDERPATIEEVLLWYGRNERDARPIQSDEIAQMTVMWRQQRWAAGTRSMRASLATALIALATRIAPTVTVPSPGTSAVAQ
jgi:hypothetical protein